MVTNVSITWEHHTTHSGACFVLKANLVDILWCMERYIRNASGVNNEV